MTSVRTKRPDTKAASIDRNEVRDGLGRHAGPTFLSPFGPRKSIRTAREGRRCRLCQRFATAQCEATLMLYYPRDWTAERIAELSLWFRGEAANAHENIPGTQARSHSFGVLTSRADDRQGVRKMAKKRRKMAMTQREKRL